MNRKIILEDYIKDEVLGRRNKIKEIGLRISKLETEIGCYNDEIYRLQNLLDMIEAGNAIIKTNEKNNESY